MAEFVLDTQDQLARLRQRIAAINTRYQNTETRPVASTDPGTQPIRRTCSGSERETSFGRHLEREKFFPGHYRHGSADVGALCELPHSLLEALGGGVIPACSPDKWAFLDTETTGLAGGTGTSAFLIGVGCIERDGFRVRQFFLRDFAEERSALSALAAHLADFEVLVTYNGRSFDQPLLESRYTLNREKAPFARLPHLDLLYGARRLWKLRLESCKLTQLESQILGHERQDDVPGHLIPMLYFDYLRSGHGHALEPVFHHNALDLVALACLTAIVPAVFRAAGDGSEQWPLQIRHGPDLAGLGRWLLAQGQTERALHFFERAIDNGLPDVLLFRCLWDVALLNKKLRRPYAAVAGFTELANCRNAFRAPALEELAKFYEHKEKNFALAMDFTCEALRHSGSPALEFRRERLQKRLDERPPRQRIMKI